MFYLYNYQTAITMKRIICFVFFVLFSFVGFAQNSGELEFLGIPIDGTKEHMYESLKAQGFEKDFLYDYMTGMFNGEKVDIYLSTNHGIVDKVQVVYPYCSEENDTRVKYNVLLSRFNRNSKYVCVNPHSEVSSEENIYLKVSDNTKYYDAVYFYLNPEIKGEEWIEVFKQEYQKYYGKQLDGLSYEEMEEALFCLPVKVSASVLGVVWFTMVDSHRININYINFLNRPRGEDL